MKKTIQPREDVRCISTRRALCHFRCAARGLSMGRPCAGGLSGLGGSCPGGALSSTRSERRSSATQSRSTARSPPERLLKSPSVLSPASLAVPCSPSALSPASSPAASRASPPTPWLAPALAPAAPRLVGEALPSPSLPTGAACDCAQRASCAARSSLLTHCPHALQTSIIFRHRRRWLLSATPVRPHHPLVTSHSQCGQLSGMTPLSLAVPSSGTDMFLCPFAALRPVQKFKQCFKLANTPNSM